MDLGRSDASSAAFFAIRGMHGVSWRINFLLDCMGVCLVLMGVDGVKQTFPFFHGALAGVWYFRRGGGGGGGWENGYKDKLAQG